MAQTNGIHRLGITGASGKIGAFLSAGLCDRFEVTTYDVERTEHPHGGRHVQVNLSRREELDGLFDGMDAIIHLAAVHRSNPTFEEVMIHNIGGTYNVLEAARQAAVQKVIFSSTNHVQNAFATGDSRELAWMDASFAAGGRLIGVSDGPAPDSFYGVSKLCGEDLGRYYANVLQAFQFIALRIGWFAPPDFRDVPLDKVFRTSETENHFRALFLSPRDCLSLFNTALDADLSFFIGYGTSDNPQPIFDLSETRRVLGFEPQDSSSDFFKTLQKGRS